MPPSDPTETTSDPGSTAPLRRRRRLIGAAAVVAVALIAVVLVWFEPQTLLFDTVVEDEFPTVAPSEPAGTPEGAADTAAAPSPPTPANDDTAGGGPAPEDDDAAADDRDDGGSSAPAAAAPVDEQPVALATGSFMSRNRYTVTGEATAYQLADQTRLLRLEGFESTNGPDLFVYLTVGDATDPDDATLAAEYVDLGELRGNIGDQNYAIPAEVDLDRFDTVVIWCRRFGTAFGATDLRGS